MIGLLARTAIFAVGLSLGAVSYAQTIPSPAAPAAKDTLNQEDKTLRQRGCPWRHGRGGIKSFADRMIRDHTAANQELTTIARGLGIDPPTALDPEHEEMRKKLTTLHGKAFDEQYMQGMVADHHKAVTLFQQEGRSGSSVQLKQFALKTLPTLQEHQKMALELTHKVTPTSAR